MSLDIDDLQRLSRELRAGPDSTHDLIEAWGVDPDGFMEMVWQVTELGMRQFMRKQARVEELAKAMFFAGFQIGYKSALEIETRRIQGGNDEVQGS